MGKADMASKLKEMARQQAAKNQSSDRKKLGDAGRSTVKKENSSDDGKASGRKD